MRCVLCVTCGRGGFIEPLVWCGHIPQYWMFRLLVYVQGLRADNVNPPVTYMKWPFTPTIWGYSYRYLHGLHTRYRTKMLASCRAVVSSRNGNGTIANLGLTSPKLEPRFRPPRYRLSSCKGARPRSLYLGAPRPLHTGFT